MGKKFLVYGCVALSALLSQGKALTAAGTVITNTAYMDVLINDQNLVKTIPSEPVSITVSAVCGLSINPNPLSLTGALGAGITGTFAFTNTGNDTFTYPLSYVSEAGMTVTGPQQVTLNQGETQNVEVQLVSTQTGTLHGHLTTTCGNAQYQADITYINKEQPLSIVKSVDKTKAMPGDLLTYTFTVHNPNTEVVRNVEIDDTLDKNLQFISSDQKFTIDGQRLKVLLESVPAGDTLVTIKAKSTDTLDQFGVDNQATLIFPNFPDLTSNTVRTGFFDGKLSISKDVDHLFAQIGDKLNYSVKVTNDSLNAVFDDVVMDDLLPDGFDLTSSSIQVDGKVVTPVQMKPLKVDLGAMKAGETHSITYSGFINAQAQYAGKLVNTVKVTGTGDGNTVTSPTATASVDIPTDQRAALIGRVFYDNNHDQVYQHDIDTPIKGASVWIAGIGQVFTDAQGRYGIPDLRPGRYGLQVQSRYLGGNVEVRGGSYGLEDAQLADIYGLTTVNFPLTPVTAQTASYRKTYLLADGLTLDKEINPVTGFDLQLQNQEKSKISGDESKTIYKVDLVLNNTTNKDQQVHLKDLLPKNSELTEHEMQDIFDAGRMIEVKAGQKISLGYHFSSQDQLPETRMMDPDFSYQK